MIDENDFQDESENIRVIHEDMPTKIRGFCCLGSDYEPIIVVNSRLSWEQQAKTVRHELDHIRHGEMFDESYVEYGL